MTILGIDTIDNDGQKTVKQGLKSLVSSGNDFVKNLQKKSYNMNHFAEL